MRERPIAPPEVTPMTRPRPRPLIPSTILLGLAIRLGAQTPAHGVVFMEPAGQRTSEDSLDTFSLVTDSSRVTTYRAWLDNMPARWALDLFDEARAIAIARDPAAAERQPPTYYVALVPGGNHGDLGFRLRTPGGVEDHPRTAFIRLGPDRWRFGITFLHETGHVVTHILAGGRKVEATPMAAIPHSTAALTNRETAFAEGYAIHLETLATRQDTSLASRNKYDHQQMLFGRVEQAPRLSEYYHQLLDLLSFAQTVSRYHEVVENTFAFRTAWTGPDYLRVQLERQRDYAELRDADQLLQSEGFYASFFYGLLFRGGHPPDVATVRERQRHTLEVLADVLDRQDAGGNQPYLVEIVRAWRGRYAEEFPEVVDVFLDLSHGVFVDAGARTQWKTAYLAALRLDTPALGLDSIERQRREWRGQVLRDPAVLVSRLGPELPCMVKGPTVQLVAFGEPAPLYFDVNTVQAGVLGMVPGLRQETRNRWLMERDRQPFRSFDDFVRRVPLSESVRRLLVFNPR